MNVLDPRNEVKLGENFCIVGGGGLGIFLVEIAIVDRGGTSFVKIEGGGGKWLYPYIVKIDPILTPSPTHFVNHLISERQV